MSDVSVSLLQARMSALQDILTQQTIEIETLRQNGQAGDKPEKPAHTENMTDISRVELEAKLEAIEARMDSRLALTNAKIDAFLSAQEQRDRSAFEISAERDKRFQDRVSTAVELSGEWNQKFRILTEQATDAARSADDSAKQAANLKNHLWASVAAQFVAVAAILVASYFANQQIGIGFAQIVQSIYESAAPAAPPTPDSKN